MRPAHLRATHVLLLLLAAVGTAACSDGGGTGDGGRPDREADVAGDADGGVPADASTDAPPAGSCRTAADCMGASPACIPPAAESFPVQPCGACLSAADECQSDDDCGPEFVCRAEGRCGCGRAAYVCVDGCKNDNECLDGQMCDELSHCVPLPCSDADDCPPQFQCDAGACARRSCQADGDCAAPGGRCVGGRCHEGFGTCEASLPPVP